MGYERAQALAAEFLDLWGFVCRSEDKCRSEHFHRLRRRLERDCQGIFRAAADDDKFWDREVRNLGLHIIARTARGSGRMARPGKAR